MRLWFHVIVWVTCGQRPVVAKLQSLAYRQFTGRDLPETLTEDKKRPFTARAANPVRANASIPSLMSLVTD